MNIRDDIKSAVESQNKTIYYRVRTGIFGGRKIPFIIKPLVESDFVTKEVVQDAMSEIANGQTIENATRVAAEALQKRIVEMGNNSLCHKVLQKAMISPKLVEKETGLADDEVPFSLLNVEMKVFLLKNVMAISPVFQR